jgi:hypothetical protein
MWVIFYRIPKSYGQVRKGLFTTDSTKVKMLRANESLMIKEDNVKTLIVAMDEDNRQMKELRK